MKKTTSRINGREFYIDEIRTLPFQGLPCFSFAEIERMKGQSYTKEVLDKIFDAKIALGAEVDNPREDIGYIKKYESPKDIAHRHASSIVSMLRAKGAVTIEEKKALLEPKTPRTTNVRGGNGAQGIDLAE